MRCTEKGCRARLKSRGPTIWNDKDTAAARAAGWFIWDRRAPLHLHGMALCPRHRNAELEAGAGPPAGATTENS